MRRYSFDDCLKDGLLRRIPASRENAYSSLGAAERWIVEAKKGLESGAFNSSVFLSSRGAEI